MPTTSFHGRKAVSCENEDLRLTLVCEGGHIAEVFDKQAAVSPLWLPPWTTREPSTVTTESHPEYGTGSEARLLSGILGHNLCLDIFGGPSPEEEALGLTAHGESSILPWQVVEAPNGIDAEANLPLGQLHVSRTLRLSGRRIHVRETVRNLATFDRPIAWTQHVTLGPPFLAPEATEFRASMKTSQALAGFGANDYLDPSAPFEWPSARGRDGSSVDLQRIPQPPSSGYTTHLADSARDDAFFVAFSPQYNLAFGYIWKRRDFPWMGIWEENHSRTGIPWNGRTLTRGMEFGVSPFPESRRAMLERGTVFGTPGFGWLPALAERSVEYWIELRHTDKVPGSLTWPENDL